MAQINPAAPHHLPSFITAPGETDVLMVAMVFILAAAVLGFGVFFLRLHTLPERIAHKGHKLQFEIVAVLGLIALFTHMHIFWVIGLVLALIDLPDFGTPLNRIAGSAEKMAGFEPGEGLVEIPYESPSGIKDADATAAAAPESKEGARPAAVAASPPKPEIIPTRQKELGHA
jgi:hypothetical protein